MKKTFRRKIFYGLSLFSIGVCLIFFGLAPEIAEKSMNKVTAVDLLATATVSNPVHAGVSKLHQRLRIADLHADSLLWNRNLLERGGYGHIDLPRLIEGNVTLQVFTTVTKTPAGINNVRNETEARDNITILALAQRWPRNTWRSLTARALHQANRLHGFVAGSSQKLMLVKTKRDLTELLKRRDDGEQIVGALLGTEGSHALDGDIGQVKTLFDAGFRMMSLQHFFDNRLGASLHGVAKTGLTKFGRQVVGEIEQLQILLDVSHSSERVVEDVLAIASRPLIVSHTGLYSHCPNARNISDRLMKKIADEGGLIGMGYWASAACDTTPSGIAKSIKAAIGVVGEDHVALGSDFDGAVTTAFDVSQLHLLTEALIDEGLSEPSIAKVMGENQIRFFAKYLPD